MAPAKSCPNREHLLNLLQGEGSDEFARQIEEHVEQCEACTKTLRQVGASDTIALAMKQNANTGASEEERRQIDTLIRDLRNKSPAGDSQFSFDSLNSPREPDLSFLAPAQSPDEIGRLGPYRILRILGQGGMGVVFEAEDPKLKRSVALKAMLPSHATLKAAHDRFLREAQSIAAIEHDHIVPIYQVGDDRGIPYLAMPLLKGETLDARLRREKTLPVGDAMRIGREIALGLAAAQERGLIHRDIKPANIWLEAKTDRVKILDFGLARPMATDTKISSSGDIMGTPAYMSPEQARGNEVDARTDVFSLGCVLYHAVTGESPFQRKSLMDTFVALGSYTPAKVRSKCERCSESFSSLIQRSIEREPSKRPLSAQKVAEELSEMLTPPSTTYENKRSWIGVFVAVAASLFAVAMCVGTVIYVNTPRGKLRIEINDPQIQVAVLGTDIVLKKADNGHDVTLKPGEKVFEVKRGAFTFKTDKLLLENGKTVTVSVEVVDGEIQVTKDGDSLIGSGSLEPEQSPALEFNGRDT